MSSKVLRVIYREYTTDGDFVSECEFSSVKEILAKDLEGLLDSLPFEMQVDLENYYRSKGLMRHSAGLKKVFRTNIMVFQNGKLISWKHLLK